MCLSDLVQVSAPVQVTASCCSLCSGDLGPDRSPVFCSNPVDLINPAAGSSHDEVIDRGDVQLPGIFFRAMRAVSDLVNAFLGKELATETKLAQN